MKVERLENNRVRFTFTVTPHEFEHGLEHAFEHIKGDVEIKGFRKGHVTRSQYENKFGVESLYEDALNHVLHHKYQEIIAYKEVEVVGEPKVEVDFNTVSKDKEFTVSVVAPVKPEVVVSNYKGVKIDKVDGTVADDEVNQAINDLLTQNSELTVVENEALKLGHTAIFDFEGFVDGVAFEGGKAENHQLEIGSNQFIPGFEEGMIGLNVGESRDVNVKFPDSYHAENLAGKDAVFKVKLHEIKEKSQSELNDNWVKTLNREGVETVDALKQQIKDQLLESKQQEAKSKMVEAILDSLQKTVSVDLPSEMIDYEVEQAKKNIENQAKQYGIDYDMYITLSGLDKDTLETQLKDQASSRILNSLVIESVVKQENIVATDEEVNNKFEELAKQYQMPVEEIKKYIQTSMVEGDIAFAKALDFLLENAVFN